MIIRATIHLLIALPAIMVLIANTRLGNTDASLATNLCELVVASLAGVGMATVTDWIVWRDYK